MKKMKRLLVAMLSCLTAFACVAGLAACGDDDSSSSSKKPANSSSSAVISSSSSSSSEEESSSSEHVHSYEEDAEQSVAPTCTTAGKKVSVCECGDKIEEEIAALGHTEEAVADVETTCTEAGLTGKTVCSVCNEVINEGTVVEALGHNYDVVAEECVAATCTEVGKLVKACTVCGDKIEEEIELLAHDYVVDEEQSYAARCEADGKTVSVCSVCNTVKEEVVPMTGHNYEGDWEPLTDATCTTFGTKVRRCSHADAEEEDGRCSSYETYLLPMLEHDWTEVAKVEPTCTTVGWTSYMICTVCGGAQNGYRGEEIPALGHDLVETAQKDATCTEAGKTDYKKCSRCDYEEGGIEIPALNHDFSVVVAEKVNPTCTVVGSETLYKCSRCEATQGGEEIAALGHTEEAVADVEATCITTGWTGKVICSTCNEILVQGEEVATIEHVYVYEAKKERTCTTWGTTTYCYRCVSGCGLTDYEIWDEVYGGTNALKTYATPAGYRQIEPLGHDYTGLENLQCGDTIKCNRCAIKLGTKEHSYKWLANGYDSTCYSEGLGEYYKASDTYRYRQCENCDYVPAEYTIAKKAHTFTAKSEVINPEVEATCTENGTTEVVKCLYCDAQNGGNVIPALGHDYQAVNAQDPTCTESGFAKYVCTRCDDVKKANGEIIYTVIPATGHTYVVDESQSYDADCVNTGLIVRVCSDCSDMQEEVVSAIGHKWVKVTKKDATCEADGYVGHKYCSVCNITDGFAVIAARGHDLVKHAAVANTCTKDGYVEYYTCEHSYCDHNGMYFVLTTEDNETFTDRVDGSTTVVTIGDDSYYVVNKADVKLEKKGHHADPEAADYVEGAEPTCTAAGKTVAGKCKDCSYIFVSKPVPALGHDFPEATCAAATVYCMNGCGETKTHEKNIVKHVAKVDASCTVDGTEAYDVCSCGAIYLGDALLSGGVEDAELVISANPSLHDFSVYHEGKDATCGEDGYHSYYTCRICGTRLEDEEGVDRVIPATGEHTNANASNICKGELIKCDVCGQEYENPDSVGKDHIYDGYTTETGTEGYDHCIICGKERD